MVGFIDGAVKAAVFRRGVVTVCQLSVAHFIRSCQQSEVIPGLASVLLCTARNAMLGLSEMSEMVLWGETD